MSNSFIFKFSPLSSSFSWFSQHFNTCFNEVSWFLHLGLFRMSLEMCHPQQQSMSSTQPWSYTEPPALAPFGCWSPPSFSLLWNSLLLDCQSDTKFRSICKRTAMRNGKLSPLTSFFLFKYDFVWPRCSDWWFGFQVWLEMQGLVTVPKLGLWNTSCSPSKEKLL